MWIKLAIVGAIALSLMGALASFIYAQREIGAANVRAKYAEQQQEAEALNAQRALEGEAYALKLLAKAEQRAKAQDAKAASDALARQAASDARAKEDIEWALYREQRVARYGVDRLRNAIVLAPTDAGSGVMPIAVSAGQGVSGATGPTEQRWADRIRNLFGRQDQTGLGGSGPSSQ